MPSIRIEIRDSVQIVFLAREKANALNAAMADELNEAVERAVLDDGVKALVLASAVPRFFSVGFDAFEVFQYDRETMAPFWRRFVTLYEELAALRKPTVAALSGNTYAGGAVLALACDQRVMAKGKYGFAISGVNLGIALPPGVMRLAVNAMGPHHARQLFLTGETIPPERALDIGLVQELAGPEKVLERAVSRARHLADKAPTAYGRVKAMFAGSEHSDKELEKTFLDQWFSREAEIKRRELLLALSQSSESPPWSAAT